MSWDSPTVTRRVLLRPPESLPNISPIEIAPICAPGIPGISNSGMPPPVACTSISISLSLSSPARSLAFSLSRLCDCDLDEIAHNLLHVAADVAHLGELGRFYLHEWSPGEPGESAGNLGFADAGRADHENIFGQYLFAHLLVELQAAPPVAQRNRHRPFRIGLADDEAIELGDDLARGKAGHR